MNLRIAGSAVRRVLIASVAAVLSAPTVAGADGLQFPFAELTRLAGIGDAISDRDERFGAAVAADGDTVVVGAPGHTGPVYLNNGAAYIFRSIGGAWTLEATFLAPSSQYQRFGASVAISGDTAVVGYPGASQVLVFVRDGGTWVEQARLSDSNSFGASVSISADTLVAGAPLQGGGGGWAAGAAVVYVRNGTTWTKQQTLLPADVVKGHAFGQSISVSGDSLVVGSPGERSTAGGLDAGSAYVFVRSGTVWSQQAKLMGGGGTGDAFGSAVALDGDSLAVSAPREQTAGGGAGYVFSRTGATWALEQRLESPRAGGSAGFGTAIAIAADTLLVGAPGEPQHSRVGVVHVFTRAGGSWNEARALVAANTGQAATGFGSSVAISASEAFVGAPTYDSSSGFVSIYRGGGPSWSAEARLSAPGTSRDDRFSSSMAMDGDTLVIGAPGDDVPTGRGRGSAYVFVRTGGEWTLQQKITADDASPISAFGASVAVSGDTLAVSTAGRNFEDIGWHYLTGGRVYVFVRVGSTWRQQAVLSVPAPDESFGFAIALDGDTLVAGVPHDDEGGVDAGSAYVFVRHGSEWSFQQKLVDALPVPSANAGYAVALEGDSVFVGAPSAGIGRVLVFERAAGHWTQQGTLSPASSARVAFFGAAIAVSSDTMLVGSPRNDDETGAAYVFERSAASWHERQKLTVAPSRIWFRVGSAVALSGDLAVIGTDFNVLPWTDVLFFERSDGSFTQRQGINAFYVPDVNGFFGVTVAVSGDTVAIGAVKAHTPSGVVSGVACIYASASADVSVDLSRSPATVAQGDLVTYKIAVTNLGPTEAPEVQLALRLSPGLVFDSIADISPPPVGAYCTALTSASCPLGTIAAGKTRTVTLVAFAAALGEQTIEASILWAGSDPNPGSNTAWATTVVVPGGPADVAVTQTAPVRLDVGATYVFHIQVANLGTDTAVGVVLRDPTPPGLVRTAVSGDCTTLPCSFLKIEPSQTKTVDVTYAIPPDYSGPDPVVNTAAVSTDSVDPNPANDVSTVVSPFFVSGPPMSFYTITPCRLLDTRGSYQGALQAGSVRSIYAGGLCNLPWNARAFAVTVTVTDPTTAGYLKVYPAGIPVPNVSTINYGAGQTRGNNAVVGLRNAYFYPPSLSVKVVQPSGTVHVIIDVFGYFE
jgi:uncharacterized repeat protein (TIGR01451 family)